MVYIKKLYTQHITKLMLASNFKFVTFSKLHFPNKTLITEPCQIGNKSLCLSGKTFEGEKRLL